VPLAFHSGREADHSPPSIAEVKEWVELYLYSPNTPSWRDTRLGGAEGQPDRLWVHPASFPMRNGVSFHGGKVDGTWSSPFTSI